LVIHFRFYSIGGRKRGKETAFTPVFREEILLALVRGEFGVLQTGFICHPRERKKEGKLIEERQGEGNL